MRILIIGAGICGLALAKRLQETPFDVTIVDHQQSPQEGGSGICLPANAVAGMEKLGLYDELMARAQQVSSIEYAKANGETLAKASLLEPPLNRGEFVSLLRSDLIQILLSSLSIPVQWGVKAKVIEHNADGVNVVLNTQALSETFDVVVAADGIHSKTRESILPGQEVEKLGMSNWRFVVNNTSATPEPVYYVGKDEAFMIYPLPKGKAYCYGHTATEKVRTSGQATSREALLDAFSRYNQEVLHKIHQLSEDDTQVIRGELETVKISHCHVGRVVLIGDALHGCPPSLQQGVGMGLEDIHTLADLLQSKPIAEALEAYEYARLPRVKWVVEESNNIVRLAAKGRIALGRVVRDALIRHKGPANVAGWRKLLTDNATS